MQWYHYLLLIIALLLVVLIIVFYFVRKHDAIKIFKRTIWKKLYRLAQAKDFYLLNKVLVNTELDTLHIDHLLVGDKYIYVVSSRYYESNVSGDSYVSPKWEVVSKEGKVIREITNPVIYNEKRTICLAKFLGWNKQKSPMFISLVVINNPVECSIKNTAISPYSFIVHRNELTKQIKKIEKESKFAPFDETSLQKIINRIHRLSVEEKKHEEALLASKKEEKLKGKEAK
ncbi:MAG: nuclease-related domain-containing protein [Bacilli bacterium]|nr:nuclease-related domain-containing protein [Bacilli bacterium]